VGAAVAGGRVGAEDDDRGGPGRTAGQRLGVDPHGAHGRAGSRREHAAEQAGGRVVLMLEDEEVGHRSRTVALERAVAMPAQRGRLNVTVASMDRSAARRAVLAAAAAVLVGAAGTSAAAHAAAPLPVTWGPASLVAGGLTPDTVPGANDFSCKPTAADPNPVVLVHGLGATLGDNWRTLAPLLKNNGFCVFGLTYGRQPGLAYVGGLQRMEDSSAELAAFVDKVLAATGAKKVDLLGHSEGTVMPRWYLSFRGGAAKVDKYVQLTPLWNGTELAGIGTLLGASRALGLEPAVYSTFAGVGCGSCPEFARGSEYLNKVNAAGPAVPGVTYTEVATKYDELVVPYTSGFVSAPNVKNILLQDVCATDYSEHLAVAYSPVVGQLVLNALDPARARPVPCTRVTVLGTANPPEVGLAPVPDAPPVPAPGAKTAGSGSAKRAKGCARGAALTLALRPYARGARVTAVTARSGARTVASRTGRALRTLRIAGLKPGRRALRLRVVTTHGTRTVTLMRTVRCAGR
jgi:triacylglycerol lipase